MRAFEEEILALFKKKQFTLSLAESCTGGLVASRLVQVAGASDYFLGSLVAYSNQAKEELLSVSHETLVKFGAVSEETAVAMASGALLAFHSDVALSITGIAGPSGATATKPVGEVSFAIVQRGKKPFPWTKHFRGERRAIMAEAADHALMQLLFQLQGRCCINSILRQNA